MSVLIVPRSLILYRDLFEVIDHQHLGGAFVFFEAEAEFLQGAGEGGVRDLWIIVCGVAEGEVVVRGEASLIEDGSVEMAL
jgi:hypothetical protein